MLVRYKNMVFKPKEGVLVLNNLGISDITHVKGLATLSNLKALILGDNKITSTKSPLALFSRNISEFRHIVVISSGFFKNAKLGDSFLFSDCIPANSRTNQLEV